MQAVPVPNISKIYTVRVSCHVTCFMCWHLFSFRHPIHTLPSLCNCSTVVIFSFSSTTGNSPQLLVNSKTDARVTPGRIVPSSGGVTNFGSEKAERAWKFKIISKATSFTIYYLLPLSSFMYTKQFIVPTSVKWWSPGDKYRICW